MGTVSCTPRLWKALEFERFDFVYAGNCFHTRKYSQTWELRPPKGLGVSGPISQVVSFARFGSKFFNMELYTWPCESHAISDRWLQRVSGGVTATTMTSGRAASRPCRRASRVAHLNNHIIPMLLVFFLLFLKVVLSDLQFSQGIVFFC